MVAGTSSPNLGPPLPPGNPAGTFKDGTKDQHMGGFRTTVLRVPTAESQGPCYQRGTLELHPPLGDQ